MRDSAAYALGTIKDPVSLNILIDLFDREKDIAVAAKAINSISMVITKSSFPLVIALKDRTREEAKKRLIQALETKLSGKKVNFYSIAEEYSGLSRAAKTPKYQIPGQDTGQSKNLKPSETKKKAPSKVHGIALKLVEKALDSESGNTKASKTSDKGGSSVNSTKADDIIKQDIVRQEKVKEDIVTQDKVKEDIVTQDKVKEEKVRQDKVTQDKVTEVQIKEDQIVGPDSVNKTVDKGPDQAKNLKKIDRLIQKLAADLKSSDEEDRKRAVTGLSKIDSPKVIPYLEEAAKDSETIVKFIAKKALKSVKQNKKSSDDSKKNEKNSGFSKKSDLNKLMPFAALFALIFLSWAVYSFFPLPFGKDEEQPDTPDVIENNIKKPVSAQNALQKNPVEPSKDTALVKELKNLLKTNNSDVIEALKWGNFNARKKKYSKAVDDFKKALDIEPDNLEAGLKYIYCLKKTGSQRRAMAFFDKRKNSSKAAQFLYTLAGPSMNTALLEIEKMINNNPSLFFADITAAYFEAAKKNYLIAADLMMKVYEDFNENIHLLIKASEFYLSGGNTEKALEILNRPDFDDDTKKIYSGIGKVNAYIKLGRLSGAVSEAENLMTKNPLNPEILYKMGKCRFQQKRFQEACDYLNRSIALNSSNYKAQYLLAQALDFTGQHKEALKLIKSASMLDPECQETWIAAAGGTSQYVPPRIHGDDEIFLPEKTASNIDPELFKF
jgi:tetratricopeptide (TPR) repeat protein